MRSIIELAFFTQDVPALVVFYRRLLGGEPAFQSDEMALFQMDGLHILIHHQDPSSPEYDVEETGPPNEDHFAIGVKALDKEWEDTGLGSDPTAIAPNTYPWGRSAYLRDPDGRLVEMHEV